ncbi:hypothetical protein B0H34DRAFT_781867 [Crassisporium funariophilum]|nr:hypothetical protein B0H34DRAFT_781867 [Crassisporium funariophilum]
MNKLNLKRTPEEERRHRIRKERKREQKRKRKDPSDEAGPSGASKRFHADNLNEGIQRKWASSDEDEEEYGPQLPKSSEMPDTSQAHKPDYDTLKAEIEEQMFRAKMFDAMGDDERLDAIETQFNDFAQVPDRWRTAGAGERRGNMVENDGYLKMDPRHMDDEEYAEWIRAGMYRKTHAEEYAEQERKKAAKAARRAEEKERRAETARLEKAAEEERKRKKLERESRRWDYAREEYAARWMALLSAAGDQGSADSNMQSLTFDDIPWPIAAAHRQKPEKRRHREEDSRQRIGVEELTAEAIATFLLPSVGGAGVGAVVPEEERKKERKDKLRETFLRFHPDKFEGRFIKRIKESERQKVREAIGQVSRVLNTLMGEGA